MRWSAQWRLARRRTAEAVSWSAQWRLARRREAEAERGSVQWRVARRRVARRRAAEAAQWRVAWHSDAVVVRNRIAELHASSHALVGRQRKRVYLQQGQQGRAVRAAGCVEVRRLR